MNTGLLVCNYQQELIQTELVNSSSIQVYSVLLEDHPRERQSEEGRVTCIIIVINTLLAGNFGGGKLGILISFC